MSTKLSVNVNKVATLRNTRTLAIPSVLRMAEICIAAGAAGITIHPRPDERHIRAHDVVDLAEMLKFHPSVEFNIEGNPFEGAYMDHIRRVRPTQCTLVPDTLEAFTSNQGWDLNANGKRLTPIIQELKSLGARVSLFMDAHPAVMKLAKEIGADRIELYTEPYASGFAAGHLAEAVAPYAAAAGMAASYGLGVNAGHDLNLANLPAFVKAVPGVLEVSIGHALIADALEFGLAETVRKYIKACEA